MIPIQAAYYLGMGIWPLLHMKSFQLVTGPKVDTWLVRSVAGLFVVIGLQLLFAPQPHDVAILGIGSALTIGIADAYYGLKGRISKVYVLDTIPQLFFIIYWCVVLL